MFYHSDRDFRFVFSNGQKDPGGSAEDSAWDYLDNCAREIQQCNSTTEQIRIVLQAIRDSIPADAVFWYPGTTGREVISTGSVNLSAEWCCRFTKRLLEDSPGVGSQLLKTSLQVPVNGSGLVPHGVAMVQLSKSRSSWIVALNFDHEKQFQPLHTKIMSLARQILLNRRNATDSYSKLKQTLMGVVRSLSTALDSKDPSTAGHSERVARMCARLGRQLLLPEEILNDLFLAGLMHDIGKMYLPENVLQKATTLTEDEWNLVKQHPTLGAEFLQGIAPLAHLSDAIRAHHEHYNGRGYPNGLAGDQIPLFARIIAIGESCDVMMTQQRYRPALATSQIQNILREGAEQQWDPRITEAALCCYKDLYAICQADSHSSVFRGALNALCSPLPESDTSTDSLPLSMLKTELEALSRS